MKVGINLPAQFPFGSTEQLLPMYDMAGFDSYWAPDHLLGVFHPGLWAETPLSALAADPDAFYDGFHFKRATARRLVDAVVAQSPQAFPGASGSGR